MTHEGRERIVWAPVESTLREACNRWTVIRASSGKGTVPFAPAIDGSRACALPSTVR